MAGLASKDESPVSLVETLDKDLDQCRGQRIKVRFEKVSPRLLEPVDLAPQLVKTEPRFASCLRFLDAARHEIRERWLELRARR
jgi:hypothetical protein